MDHSSDSEDQEIILTRNACNYKTSGEYPPGATDNMKRSIRRKAKKFEVSDGEVFYIQTRGERVRT
jgi:hypothetical protein